MGSDCTDTKFFLTEMLPSIYMYLFTMYLRSFVWYKYNKCMALTGCAQDVL